MWPFQFRGGGQTTLGVIHGSPNLDEMLGSHDGGIAFSTLGTMFRDGSEIEAPLIVRE